MLRFKHYTVAVNDLDEAVANYQARFGMEPIGEQAHNSIGNFQFRRMGFGDEVMLHLIRPESEESPIYRLIFRRLHRLGIDWRYTHPRLSLVDLSGVTGQLEEEEGSSEVYQYDPTESYWRDKELAKHKKEITEMQEELDDVYRESVEQARTSPPPRTVQAYQQIYGHWPVGWPPHADQED